GHHHKHGESCGCGHEHHGHHHADEVFQSLGILTTKTFSKEDIQAILNNLGEEHLYGFILRAKGMVQSSDGKWIHFDYVPEEMDIRDGEAQVTGKICVIGSKINQDALKTLIEG
ncbi:MAG: GTP-binding protein, partial [Clostridia bacterium]